MFTNARDTLNFDTSLIEPSSRFRLDEKLLDYAEVQKNSTCVFVILGTQRTVQDLPTYIRLPRSSCSLSIASNNDLKFPAPKPEKLFR